MKIPLLATFLTICGIIVLCSLGTWQLQRLEWKTGILNALEAAKQRSAAPTLTIEEIAALAANPDDTALIRNVFLRGRWLHGKEIALGPRTWKGKTGFHILTPMELESGGVALVNRGWVPADKKDAAQRPESLVPAEDAMAMGILRRPGKASFFVPDNAPQSEQWYNIDLEQMAKARGFDSLAPLVLYASLDRGTAELPVKEALEWKPNNDHLAYALFWFTMAAAMAVIYYLRFFRFKS